MARRKSSSINAPSTLAEASAILAKYGRALTTIECLRAEYDQKIAAMQAERDLIIAPIESGMKDMFIGLRAWWAVAAPGVTGGKRKTAEIAGCLLGLRINTPSLKLPKDMREVDIVDWLRQAGDNFVTISIKPNKPELISLLRGEDGPDKSKLLAKGFGTRQAEQFFIDRVKIETAPADPDQIPGETAWQGEST